MKTVVISCLFLLFAMPLFAASLSDFSIAPGDGRIVVRWEAADESGLARYILERSVDRGEYVAVATVTARGANQTYQFTDTDLYSVDRSPRTFSYRLKFVNRDNTTSYSITREATIQISSIRRTWGSVKAMFR